MVEPFLLNASSLASELQPSARLAATALARGLLNALRRGTRLSCSVTPEPCRIMTFAELSVPASGEAIHLRADGWSAPGFLFLDKGAAGALIHAFLGGGDHGAAASGERGSLASGLLLRLGRAASEEFGGAFPEDHAPKIRVLRRDNVLDLAMPPSEGVFVQPLSLRVGDGVGEIMLAFPLQAIAPRLKRIGVEQRPRAEASREISALLSEAEVEVVAILGDATILLGDALSLAVGDVLQLGVAHDAAWALKVEGRTKAFGKPGVSRGQRALRITKA